MKHRLLITLAALAWGGLTLAIGGGQLTFIYQTTDADLLVRIEQARRWKDFFLISFHTTDDPGDWAWAAYYAGREAVLVEQYVSLGLPYPSPGKPNDR